MTIKKVLRGALESGGRCNDKSVLDFCNEQVSKFEPIPYNKKKQNKETNNSPCTVSTIINYCSHEISHSFPDKKGSI